MNINNKISNVQSKEQKLIKESNKLTILDSDDKIIIDKDQTKQQKNIFMHNIDKNNLMQSNIPQAIKLSFFNKSKIKIENYPKASGRFSEIYEGLQGNKKFAIKMVN